MRLKISLNGAEADALAQILDRHAGVLDRFEKDQLACITGKVRAAREDARRRAAAARVGYAAPLAQALTLGAFEGGRTGWEQAIVATHPPTELRIDRLLPTQDDDWEYQEDELRAPTADEVKRLLTFWRRRPKQPPA